MGYEVHITRKSEWSDEEGPIISEAEWRAYVSSDRDLVTTGVAECETPDGTLRITDPLLTEWRAHSSGATVWISHFRGNFSIKNPDEECLCKMRQIAKALGARVQGDDGEFYDESPSASKQARQPSLMQRASRVLTSLFPRKPPTTSGLKLDFDIGDRVMDTWGNMHTVIAIDRTAEHGTGIIRTRRDDGQEFGHAIFAHDLTRAGK